MLISLSVKNVALIESAEINFSEGLNVLSGETGSGKSVILESINFVLGAKADRTLIRTGASECCITAEFDIAGNTSIVAILDDFGFDKDDSLIITRKFSETGKNSIKINGNSATVSMLKTLTSALIDVHGQSEHFLLLESSNQLKLIDKFAGEHSSEIKEKLKATYFEYKTVLKELSAAGGDESSRLIRLDVLNYQINEISSADLKENEFEDLTAIKQKLLHREKIISALNTVKNGIEDEGGVLDVLANSARCLNGIADVEESYSALSERLNDVYAEIDDIESSINGFLDDLEYSEYSLDEVDARLTTVKTIFKKYGGDYDAVLKFYDDAIAEKEKLENFNEYAAGLTDKLLEYKKRLYELYNDLSDNRRKFAEIFSEKVISELNELGMTKARFYVDFSEKPTFDDCKFDSANGFDSVSFMFSANSGEPVKPLSSVISGGEMSRFMLAVKAQTAKYNEISTFIFDEIDAGISGVVANVVAEKLAKISCHVQVIAVSHLPQIVSFADRNLLIVKSEYADKTVTTVKILDYNEKINEITRLLGGVQDGDSKAAQLHAKELINFADKKKLSL